MAGKASFNWIDPLLLDQQLTEEERMIRDTAEQFAQQKPRRGCWKRFVMRRPTRRFSARWVRSACWGQPFLSSTVAVG